MKLLFIFIFIFAFIANIMAIQDPYLDEDYHSSRSRSSGMHGNPLKNVPGHPPGRQ
ncbi:hypothetical protein Mgra_00008115 [Meloidogyne graminicola]|uniref:Uncharacterized protein n=1 Tax=Meloidogyne graminicola TaxID=189291 RepID=A0A8S9ZGU9_9BILA|nr:hypothetical protein Mgra_00008115 [Meloidogyne graminicola]